MIVTKTGKVHRRQWKPADVQSSSDAATDHCDIKPELNCDIQRLVGRLITKTDQLLAKKTRK